MANINELLARAAALRDETALNSISPERAGGIMYDTLVAMNELWLQQGAALVISKIYASVAAMEADTEPISDLTGQPLRSGQIVVIASSDSDNGSVYRYNGPDSPSWSLVGSIGNLQPVDNLESDSTSLPLAAHQGKVLDGKISQLVQKVNELDFGDTLASKAGNPNGSIACTFENGKKYYVKFTIANSPTLAITLRSADGSAGPTVQTIAASTTYSAGTYIIPFTCEVDNATYIRLGESSVWSNISAVVVANTDDEKFDKAIATISRQIFQLNQNTILCSVKSGGGAAVSSITKNSVTATLVFSGDTCFFGYKDNDIYANAYKIFATNGVSYSIGNLQALVLDFSDSSLTVKSISSQNGVNVALNSPSKAIVAVNIWGYLMSPIPSLQAEFDAIQYRGQSVTITENTPDNYSTQIVQGGTTHRVANGNVSDIFKNTITTFGFYEKTGTRNANKKIGMPISVGGILQSVYLNVAESATASIKIYNSDFSVARKTISANLSAGENTVSINEVVYSGENVVVENCKAYFADDSQFEQIYWYDYGAPTGWALRSDHIKWSAGYKVIQESTFESLQSDVTKLQNDVEQLQEESLGITYVEVTVQRNAADFNSIRETIAGITDASYYKRYIVKVPEGRWFECDINGKDYVTIQGVEASRTILYCDGTSDKVTPDDYSFATYAGQSLSSINQAYKHIINVLHNIDVRGLTLEVNDCKYCAHIDKTSFKTASYKNVFFHEMNANVTFTIGIGSHAGQEITFEGCDFKAYDTHTICAYVHNWNNLTAINTITFRDCQFNKSFMRYDELGSDYTTFVNLLNCYSKAETPQLVFQTVTTGGHSHWIDPSTGQPIEDMTQLPYCTILNIIGSNVASIYQDGTRPDIADYIIGKIG